MAAAAEDSTAANTPGAGRLTLLAESAIDLTQTLVTTSEAISVKHEVYQSAPPKSE